MGLSYTLDYEQSREAFKVVGNIFDNPELIPKEVYGRLMEMIKNDDYWQDERTKKQGDDYARY